MNVSVRHKKDVHAYIYMSWYIYIYQDMCIYISVYQYDNVSQNVDVSIDVNVSVYAILFMLSVFPLCYIFRFPRNPRPPSHGVQTYGSNLAQ